MNLYSDLISDGLKTRKAVLLRSHPGSQAFEIAVSYLASLSGKDAQTTGEALSILENDALKKYVNAFLEEKKTENENSPELKKRARGGIAKDDIELFASALKEKNLVFDTNEGLSDSYLAYIGRIASAAPETKFYLLILGDSPAKKKREANPLPLLYRGQTFYDDRGMPILVPENVFIIKIAEGFYAKGSDVSLYSQIVVQNESDSITDSKKRELYRFVLQRLREETGMAEIAMGTELFRTEESLQQVVVNLESAIYNLVPDHVKGEFPPHPPHHGPHPKPMPPSGVSRQTVAERILSEIRSRF